MLGSSSRHTDQSYISGVDEVVGDLTVGRKTGRKFVGR
jgi:hypothetical protein